MLIDGEKWACEACVRGHRVSNCQHSDRPLQHINKKGRPVSQCGHCRSMRKSRSAHSKCDCGERSHKCAHLKATVDGHKDSCCCNHGGRCTCSHKKEHLQLDPVPESDSDQESAPHVNNTSSTSLRTRRRANTLHTEGVLSFDDNGRHKPAHRVAKASRKYGPYQLNRVNSTSALDSRSAEAPFRSGGLGDSSSPTSSFGSSNENSKAKSDTGSPLMTGSSSFAQMNCQLPPLDLSAIEYPPYVPNSFDIFGSLPEHEQPIFSAGLSAASVDWSHYDGLEFASKTADFAPSNYSQPQSYGGYDLNGSEQPPTLTTSTSISGETSEVDDFFPHSFEDLDASQPYCSSVTGTSFGLTPMRATAMGRSIRSALDYDDFRLLKAGNKFLPTPSSLASDEPVMAPTSAARVNSSYQVVHDDPALWMSGDYTTGLSGLSSLTDPADPNMPSFWDTQ